MTPSIGAALAIARRMNKRILLIGLCCFGAACGQPQDGAEEVEALTNSGSGGGCASGSGSASSQGSGTADAGVCDGGDSGPSAPDIDGPKGLNTYGPAVTLADTHTHREAQDVAAFDAVVADLLWYSPDAYGFLSRTRDRYVSEPDLVVTFGFTNYGAVGSEDLIFSRTGLSLTTIFTCSGACCERTEVTEESLVAEDTFEPWNSSGICAVLAVAHSLVYRLEVIDEAGATNDNGKTWDPNFLEQVRNAGELNGSGGMTLAEQQKAHEVMGSNEDYNVECGGQTVAPSGGAALEQWCEDLADALSDDDDCTLRLRGPNGGHAVNATGASFADGKCKVETVDTGVQRGSKTDPRGSNVPTSPGDQEWSVGGGGIENTEGNSQDFWNGQNFNRSSFYCCDETPTF